MICDPTTIKIQIAPFSSVLEIEFGVNFLFLVFELGPRLNEAFWTVVMGFMPTYKEALEKDETYFTEAERDTLTAPYYMAAVPLWGMQAVIPWLTLAISL